jgi:hypothetical protein
MSTYELLKVKDTNSNGILNMVKTINNRDVDKKVQLSDEAWVSFEGDFDSEVQGLFAESDRSHEQGKMLLLTWYRDLSVWETSRKPSPEARERFLKRHSLTIETTAIASRLFLPK